jgi:transcriptional regulator with XRE-family HTH domain
MLLTHMVAAMTTGEEPEWRVRADQDRDLLDTLGRRHAEKMAELNRQLDEDRAELRRALLNHERVLCQKVAQLREERGWSQAELARRLSAVGFEMHQTTVAKLEAGKRPLRVAETFALAEVFGLPPLAMWYMPVKGEDHGMEYMRERLSLIDESIEKSRDASMRILDKFAESYGLYSAQRFVVAENMRRAAAEHAKGDDGEHQET